MSLNPGFSNNINKVAIRSSPTSVAIHTDRSLDTNGDGVKEAPSIVTTSRGASTMKDVVTVPTGYKHSIVEKTAEAANSGVNESETIFTEGV